MFIRKWEFYLAMCIGSFAGERTDVVQFELSHA
jgi:cyclopropane fatty-acyl-phospholipid synthase-like methyltransferase